PFQLVTIGNAFHWMDRERTLRALDRMVEPGGGMALAGGRAGGIVIATRLTSTPGTSWQQVVQEVIRRWLREARRAGSGTYVPPAERHEAVLTRSPFPRFERCQVTVTHRWNPESLIGHLYSTSFCSPAVLGERREPFESDLRAALLALDPGGEFPE